MQNINLIKNKKAFCPIVDDLEVGDLIHYCPKDMDKKYHDFGIVIEVELNEINYKNYINKIKVFWRNDCQTMIHSRNQILNSISPNLIKLNNENYEMWKIYKS